MFFGWYVVVGTLVSQLFVVGFFTYSVSLLVPFVRDEFGVSMAEVMYSLSAGTFGGMLLLPVAGVMLDRYPVRWIMSGGALLFAAGLWALGNTTSITQYIVLFGLTMAVANAFAGATASSATVSRWFTTSRGRALGISAIGTSAGGIAIPVLVTWWLQAYGWRTTLEYLALTIAVIVVPVLVLTIRGKPADIGLLPEGVVAGTAETSATGPELKLGDIIRMPSYWYLGLALGLLFSVYTAILASIAPYAIGVGVTAAQASSLIMAVAIMGFVGKLAFGVVSDKMNPKLGLWLAMALVLVAFLLLAIEPGYALMLVAAGFLGLASGGLVPIWGAMVATVFGLVSYGRAMGVMGPLITLCVMPGFAIAGSLFDLTGNYRLCLYLFAGITVVAMLLLMPLKLTASESSTTAPG